MRAEPAFEAIENDTVPFPAPEDPDVTLIHDAFGVADQLQPLGAVTFVEPLLSAAPTDVVVVPSE